MRLKTFAAALALGMGLGGPVAAQEGFVSPAAVIGCAEAAGAAGSLYGFRLAGQPQVVGEALFVWIGDWDPYQRAELKFFSEALYELSDEEVLSVSPEGWADIWMQGCIQNIGSEALLPIAENKCWNKGA